MSQDKLRLVVILDRVKGSVFGAILNEENHTWAPITEGEHQVVNSDNYDECFDAINIACEDIIRWGKTMNLELDADAENPPKA